MVYLYTKDPLIRNVINRLINDGVAKTSSKVAQQFSRYTPVRYMRQKDRLYIGKDHKKDISLIYIDGCNIKIKGNKYFFEL